MIKGNNMKLLAIDFSHSIIPKIFNVHMDIAKRITGNDIDVITFDTIVKDETYKSTYKSIDEFVQAEKKEFRGGTDYQCVIDYASNNNITELFIYTDGYAPEPTIPYNINVTWLFNQQTLENPFRKSKGTFADLTRLQKYLFR